MIAKHDETLPSAATISLALVLRELDDPSPRTISGYGLPAGAIDLIANNLIIAVTPVTQPIFGTALRCACDATHRDIILIRHGFHPEVLDPVEADVAVRTSGGSLLIERMSFFRHRDGSLHLVPTGHDLFGEITATGLDLSMVPPWNCSEEFSDGLMRAAAEFVRAYRRVLS